MGREGRLPGWNRVSWCRDCVGPAASSPRRRRGSCAAPPGTPPSWSGCARGARPGSSSSTWSGPWSSWGSAWRCGRGCSSPASAPPCSSSRPSPPSAAASGPWSWRPAAGSPQWPRSSRAARPGPTSMPAPTIGGRRRPAAAPVARRVPAADLHAADTDRRALESARRNLPPSAALHRGDGLDALPGALMGRIDVIAAVPPYVPDHAEELMPREARDHESQAALLGGRDGLEQVRRLTDAAPRWLAPGGQLLIEMHRAQARVMTDVLHATAQYARAEIVEWEEGGTAVLRLRRDGPPGP